MTSFPETLEPLLRPSAYPHPAGAVQLVETHISWILLTGDFAYKIKRPVAFPFVDLRSAEHRAFLCREEVRLNRRFAPDIYLGVSNITAAADGVCIDGSGAILERAVKMRQFERKDELDTLLGSGRIDAGELAALGADLARIHAQLPGVDPGQPWGNPTLLRSAILRNWQECVEAVSRAEDASGLQSLRLRLEQQLDAAGSWMEKRRAAGRVRECHGDLHCSNVVRLNGRLTAFDCLEFEPAFRWLDVADEIAFLLADLQALERPLHAQAFLGAYLAQSGDFEACRFLDLYKGHRSLVRAKVEALSGKSTHAVHLRSAHESLAPKQPKLLLMSGLSGSGKTWLAQRLAPVLGALHIRSDVERKRLAGLSELERTGSPIAAGLYSQEVSARVHEHLVRSAEAVLEGGYTTIVDATFSRREERAQFARLAERLGITAYVVLCAAPLDVLRSRVVERQRQGNDSSEADVAVLEWQQTHYEQPQADEGLTLLNASTGDPQVVEQLCAALKTQKGAAAGSCRPH